LEAEPNLTHRARTKMSAPTDRESHADRDKPTCGKTPVRLTTPRLTLRFPRLRLPDYGTADYPKPDGEYSTWAVGCLTNPSVTAFIAALVPLHHAAQIEAEEQFRRLKPETRRKLGGVKMSDLFMTMHDNVTELPTGDIQFKFAMRASGVSLHEERIATMIGRTPQRWHRRPDIFDSRCVLIDDVPEILGGTVARISCDVVSFFVPGTAVAGLKLTLAGVQIIRLIAPEEPEAAKHGFTAEDDGYVHDTTKLSGRGVFRTHGTSWASPQ
jgi:hypothetical protein